MEAEKHLCVDSVFYSQMVYHKLQILNNDKKPFKDKLRTHLRLIIGKLKKKIVILMIFRFLLTDLMFLNYSGGTLSQTPS